MKGANIVQGFQKLREAKEFFEDFIRSYPDSKGAKIFKSYIGRIEWIVNDTLTNPNLPDIVREGIKQEWNSDIFAVPEITHKIALLSPEKRNLVETIIQSLLTQDNFKIEIIKNEEKK